MGESVSNWGACGRLSHWCGIAAHGEGRPALVSTRLGFRTFLARIKPLAYAREDLPNEYVCKGLLPCGASWGLHLY